MPDQVLPPRESYMVVVAGAMKPAIHHLQWYRKINAIDDNELAAALINPTGITTPIVSQLQFGIANPHCRLPSHSMVDSVHRC